MFSNEKFSGKNEICAFCITGLTSSDATELKTLIQNEWKVQPSSNRSACLSLNLPKPITRTAGRQMRNRQESIRNRANRSRSRANQSDARSLRGQAGNLKSDIPD